LGAAGGDSLGVVGGDSLGVVGGDSWGAAGGDSWGDVDGDSWTDVDLPKEAPKAVAAPREPPASASPGDPIPKAAPNDLSGVAPAIVDSARVLRRFVDKVPRGVLIRVMRSRVKTISSVRSGLKDLCTLVKEYGTDQPVVMDAYRMVDHALPRVREKQAMKVLTAIFGVK
jgi:hypothetical protein